MGYVDYEQEGHVGIVTINRPKALNALNEEVLKDLETVFDAIDQETVRAVILTGAGEKSFVAGADIAGAMEHHDQRGGEAFGKFGNDIFRKIETFPIPVIAAVNGFALGGGNELSLSCDIRICSENAVFGQPEVGLGITRAWRYSETCPHHWCGKGQGDALHSQKHQADEAYRLGLVNAVYPQED